jgi:DNA-binding beta-propeller fold protein YncE
MRATARICRTGVLLMAAALAVAEAAAPVRASAHEYVLSARITGPGGAWDYAVVDDSNSRLYLAQQGVTALDLGSGELTHGLLKGGMTHGLAPLGDGSVAVDDAVTKTITVFNGATGQVRATINTARDNPVAGVHALDALVREPKTGQLAAVNGESGLLLLVDLERQSVVGTVKIGGKPEYAAADGVGRIYINVSRDEKAEIVAVDVLARKVVGHIPLLGCEEPTGLAYDREADLLMSVCDNGIAKFIRAGNAEEVASLPVGKGADAIMFDPRRRRAFVPGAESGTLSIIAVRSASDIAVVQTLDTQRGTRLGAVDSATGKVYLPAAKFGPPVPPSPYPSVVPGSFVILVVAPALTLSGVDTQYR